MIPYFSIVIPLYNKEQHIVGTLNSVFAQTFADFEVIVVNDGSTDDSLKELDSFNDIRLHIHTIENQGVSHARNYGISKANADLIAFLDADDIWFEHHLQDLKGLYEQFPDCGMYCKAYDKKDGDILIASKFNTIPNQNSWSGIVNDYFKCSLINSIAWTSAVMVPMQTFEKTGNFNTAYNSGEDTDLWIRIALKFCVAFSNEVSAIHNLSSDNKITDLKLSSRNHLDFNDFKIQEKQNESLKKYLDLNRYSVAIQYKLENNKTSSQKIYEIINNKHLTTQQKLLFSFPNAIIKLLLKSRHALRRLGLDLRMYRG